MMLLAWLSSEVRLALLALQFLTRVRVPAHPAYGPARIQASVRYFPWVGALVGGFGAIVAVVAGSVWPPIIAAAATVGGTVWLTAAFHEDGLADTADALMGAASREQALAIMKDSRIGTYGATALTLSLLLHVLLLAQLLAFGWAIAAAALVASHAAGRAVAVALMASLPYARDGGQTAAEPSLAKAGSLAGNPALGDAALAVLSGLLILILAVIPLNLPVGIIAVATLALSALLMAVRRWLRERIGGYTGDTLGAVEQVGELLVLLCFAARWG